MAVRERPVVVSTRVSPRERGLIGAIASAEGVSVCAALHSILIPAVRTRLSEIAADSSDDVAGVGAEEEAS